MAYVKYIDDKKEILIYEERLNEIKAYKLGDLLFSFLELDFTEYNEIYTFCGYDNDFDQSTINFLKEKYPKTAEECTKDYVVDQPNHIRDYSLDFLLNNMDTFGDLYSHPYLHFSTTIMEGCASSFESEYFDANFQDLQKTFRELINFCFLELDNTDLNNLSPIERYYLFTASKHLRFKYILNLHTTVLFSPQPLYEDIENKYVFHSYSNEDIPLSEIPNDIIKQIKGNAKVIVVNKCETVQDFCFFELYTLLSNNFSIKRCANCEKLFIPSGKYNTDCCDRVPEGEKYSCKKIMAQKRRKEKVNSNPITKEYERAYKRNYARLTNHKMSSEDFRLWVEEATRKRDMISAEYDTSQSDQLIAEFKQYLGNK